MSGKERVQSEERFSFSCNDFSSSSIGAGFDDDNYDSDGSYIEIELEPSTKSSKYGHALSDADDDEIELRISISSKVPLPQLSAQSFRHAISVLESGSSKSPSSSISSSRKASVDNDKTTKLSNDVYEGGRSGGRLQFPAINRLLSMLVSSLKVRPEICQDDNIVADHHEKRYNENIELIRPRKSSKTQMTMKGGITEFFIKARAMQVKKLIASIMKSRKVGTTDEGKSSQKSKNKRFEETVDQFYRKMAAGGSAKKPAAGIDTNKHKRSSSTSSSSSWTVKRNIGGNKWSVLEVNLNGKKGIIEAIRDSCKGGNSRMTSTLSCPGSIRSSPLHAGESSIQAAIAHCKSSLTPFPGFYF